MRFAVEDECNKCTLRPYQNIRHPLAEKFQRQSPICGNLATEYTMHDRYTKLDGKVEVRFFDVSMQKRFSKKYKLEKLFVFADEMYLPIGLHVRVERAEDQFCLELM